MTLRDYGEIRAPVGSLPVPTAKQLTIAGIPRPCITTSAAAHEYRLACRGCTSSIKGPRAVCSPAVCYAAAFGVCARDHSSSLARNLAPDAALNGVLIGRLIGLTGMGTRE